MAVSAGKIRRDEKGPEVVVLITSIHMFPSDVLVKKKTVIFCLAQNAFLEESIIFIRSLYRI